MGKKNQGKSIVEQVAEVEEFGPDTELPREALDAQEGRDIQQLIYQQDIADAEQGVEVTTVLPKQSAEAQARRNASKLEEEREWSAKLAHNRAMREAAAKGLAEAMAERLGGSPEDARAKAEELIASASPESLRELADQVVANRKLQLQARAREKGAAAGQGLAAGAAARVPKVAKKPADAAAALDRKFYAFLRALEDGGNMAKNRANGGLFAEVKLEGEVLELFKSHPVGKTMGSKWSAFCWHLEYAGGRSVLRVDKAYTKDVNAILSAYLAKDAAARIQGSEASTDGEEREGLLIPQDQVDVVLALKRG